MEGSKGGQIDNSEDRVPRTYQDKAPTLSDEPGTSWALWQLSLVLREIAEFSQRGEAESTSGEDK